MFVMFKRNACVLFATLLFVVVFCDPSYDCATQLCVSVCVCVTVFTSYYSSPPLFYSGQSMLPYSPPVWGNHEVDVTPRDNHRPLWSQDESDVCKQTYSLRVTMN